MWHARQQQTHPHFAAGVPRIASGSRRIHQLYTQWGAPRSGVLVQLQYPAQPEIRGARLGEHPAPSPRPRALLEGRGAHPSPLNAPPTTLPEGTSATPIPPPSTFPTANDCPPTDFTVRPNRFVTALEFVPRGPSPSRKSLPCPLRSHGRNEGNRRPEGSRAQPTPRWCAIHG